MGQFITVEPIALAFQHSYCKNKRVQLFSASQCIHCVPKKWDSHNLEYFVQS